MEKGLSFPKSLETLLIERALGEEAARKAAEGNLSGRELQSITSAMLELSDWFNGLSAKNLTDYMQSRWHRAAYFLYFLPANVLKARTVLAELSPTFAGREDLSMLDVGSGPGSATLALLDFAARETGVTRLRLEAMDSSTDALADWRFLVDGYSRTLQEETRPLEISVRTRRGDVSSVAPLEGPWDIVFFGDTLNELFRDAAEPEKARAALLARYGERLADSGAIVLVEPALKTTSRSLAAVCGILAREHGFSIYAPCLGESSCPMAAPDGRDWPHVSIAWARPRIVARIDHLADRKKVLLKFSYCVARRHAGHPVDLPETETPFRVAGDVLVEKGKRHALLCGAAGCTKFVLLDRDMTEPNEAFVGLARGDIVSIDAWDVKGDGARLTRESRVRLLRRFAPE